MSFLLPSGRDTRVPPGRGSQTQKGPFGTTSPLRAGMTQRGSIGMAGAAGAGSRCSSDHALAECGPTPAAFSTREQARSRLPQAAASPGSFAQASRNEGTTDGRGLGRGAPAGRGPDPAKEKAAASPVSRGVLRPSMVGETGFEPANPWSRTAPGELTWRGTGYDGEPSRGIHWRRAGGRIAYRGTDRIRSDAIWRAGGAAREGRRSVDVAHAGGRASEGEPRHRVRARQVRRAPAPPRRTADQDPGGRARSVPP